MGFNETLFKKIETRKHKLNNGPELNFITIQPCFSIIKFKIQDGPIKEYGENGCQIEELGKMWLALLRELNNICPCDENLMTMHHIGLALKYQALRTTDRKIRKVEGSHVE